MEYYRLGTVRRGPVSSGEAAQVDDLARKEPATFHDLPPIVVDNNLEIMEGNASYEIARKLNFPLVRGFRRKIYVPRPHFPSRVSLEITSHCNASCRMCSRQVLTRPQQHMDLDVVRRILDECGRYGIECLCLYRLGDPLLHPHLGEILDHLRRYDNLSPIWLSTNGMELNAQNGRMILASNVDFFQYSMNALNAQQYAAINPSGNFERIQANVDAFLELRRKTGRRKPFFRVQILEQWETVDSFDEFLRTWADKADVLHFGHLELKHLPANRGFASRVESRPTDTRCALALFGDVNIYTNGAVVPCYCDVNAVEIPVGNIFQKSLREIWEDAPFQRFMALHRAGRRDEIPLCAACTDWKLFAAAARDESIRFE